MIPGFVNVSVPDLGFVIIGSGLVLLAWSRFRSYFGSAFLIASLLMVATWLSSWDALGLIGFILPPYFAVRYMWGNQTKASGFLVGGIVIWEVLLFVVLRRYEWVDTIQWLAHPISVIGLSYMLFRIIHLVIDAPVMGEHRLNLRSYLSYVLAFWTLISGPIQRYDDFVRGMENIGRPETDVVLGATHRITNGLIKAFVIAPIFLEASDINLLKQPGAETMDFAVVFYAYPIYLFLNFSGYTDVVIALSRLCGVTTLPENFNRPYLARNIQDFWGRWHISFGVWIKSYIFTPLTKQLIQAGNQKYQGILMAFAVIVTFLVVGVWHGTTTNFLFFGLLHGIAVLTATLYGIALKRILGKKGRKAFIERPWVNTLAIVLCFHYVCATLALIPNHFSDIVVALEIFFT